MEGEDDQVVDEEVGLEKKARTEVLGVGFEDVGVGLRKAFNMDT